jgi:ABC-2 type transport system permease protein
MMAFTIAKKNIKELFRNFKSNSIIFLIPIAFMGIFAIAFGGSMNESQYELAVIENENEIYINYLGELANLKVNDEVENSLFEISYFSDLEQAQSALEEDYVLIIEWKEDKVAVYGNPTNANFIQVTSLLESFTRSFFQIENTVFEVNAINVNLDDNLPAFHYMVPGLIIYGILILIPQVAQSLSEITEKKYIFRYFTSKVKARDIILGYFISQTFIAFIQTLILFAVALIFGFSPAGSLLAAIFITLITNIFVVGLGLIIGGSVKNTETASNIGSLISIILGFMSGSFIVGVEDAFKFNLFGRNLSIPDLFPTKYATEAMNKIILEGKDISYVGSEILIILVSGIVTLFIGIMIYNKRQLSKI